MQTLAVLLLAFGLCFHSTSVLADAIDHGYSFVIDVFEDPTVNALNVKRSGELSVNSAIDSSTLSVTTGSLGDSFITRLSDTCRDMRRYENAFLHIDFTGSLGFHVALRQHNEHCNDSLRPYPETWSSLDANRYSYFRDSKTDPPLDSLYIPLSHFNIDKRRVEGLALKGFTPDIMYQGTNFSRIEIVRRLPSAVSILVPKPSSRLSFGCKRPHSFAFVFDEGNAVAMREIRKILRDENILATFFPGLSVKIPISNRRPYKVLLSDGHQFGWSLYIHRCVWDSPYEFDTMWNYHNDIKSQRSHILGTRSRYFRSPATCEDSQESRALTQNIPDAMLVGSDMPEYNSNGTDAQVLEAFQDGLDMGGSIYNLNLMGNNQQSAVRHLGDFIRLARKAGKDIMRPDQCLMDPSAPQFAPKSKRMQSKDSEDVHTTSDRKFQGQRASQHVIAPEGAEVGSRGARVCHPGSNRQFPSGFGQSEAQKVIKEFRQHD